jgi:hypothetical protein
MSPLVSSELFVSGVLRFTSVDVPLLPDWYPPVLVLVREDLPPFELSLFDEFELFCIIYSPPL